MNERPLDKPQSSTAKKVLGGLGLLALIIVVMRAGPDAKTNGPESKVSPAAEAAQAASGPAEVWAARDLGGLSLDAPFSFKPGADVTSKLPAAAREVVEAYEVFEGVPANPQAKVSRISYRAGTELSLTDAMDGAMRAVATATGDTNPKFNPTEGTVDGLPSCRASYTGTANGKALHVDAAFVQSGTKMWQVQVVSIGDFSASDTKRMLDSIHIRAGSR